MADNFNTYIEHIEPEFWRELCVKEGKPIDGESTISKQGGGDANAWPWLR